MVDRQIKQINKGSHNQENGVKLQWLWLANPSEFILTMDKVMSSSHETIFNYHL